MWTAPWGCCGDKRLWGRGRAHAWAWGGNKSTEEGLLPRDRFQVSFSITAARAPVYDIHRHKITHKRTSLAYFKRMLLTRRCVCALGERQPWLFNPLLVQAETPDFADHSLSRYFRSLYITFGSVRCDFSWFSFMNRCWLSNLLDLFDSYLRTIWITHKVSYFTQGFHLTETTGSLPGAFQRLLREYIEVEIHHDPLLHVKPLLSIQNSLMRMCLLTRQLASSVWWLSVPQLTLGLFSL